MSCEHNQARFRSTWKSSTAVDDQLWTHWFYQICSKMNRRFPWGDWRCCNFERRCCSTMFADLLGQRLDQVNRSSLFTGLTVTLVNRLTLHSGRNSAAWIRRLWQILGYSSCFSRFSFCSLHTVLNRSGRIIFSNDPSGNRTIHCPIVPRRSLLHSNTRSWISTLELEMSCKSLWIVHLIPDNGRWHAFFNSLSVALLFSVSYWSGKFLLQRQDGSRDRYLSGSLLWMIVIALRGLYLEGKIRDTMEQSSSQLRSFIEQAHEVSASVSYWFDVIFVFRKRSASCTRLNQSEPDSTRDQSVLRKIGSNRLIRHRWACHYWPMQVFQDWMSERMNLFFLFDRHPENYRTDCNS